MRNSMNYLTELKYRLLYAVLSTYTLFAVTYLYKEALLFLLLPQGLSHFVSTGMTEVFISYIQICTYASFAYLIPQIVLQFYLFFQPALYSHEAKTLKSFFAEATVFYVGLYLAVFPLLAQTIWKLFYYYSVNFTPIHLTFEPRLNDYVNFIKQLAITLSLSLPLIVGIGALQSKMSGKFWGKLRGVFYVLLLTLSALITPPDLLSQMLTALPMILFFETQTFWGLVKKKYYSHLLVWQPVESCQNTNRKKKKS